jgi:hypothetical protein
MNTPRLGLAVGALLLANTLASIGHCSEAGIPQATAPASPMITWTTPSTNAAGSMPLGNGDISVNVWAETNGDLLLYIGKCDSWDENGRLLKLGRLRLHFSNHPFAAATPFRQTLLADRGEIEIAAGQAGAELRVRIWVDANRPVVRIETESDQDLSLEAGLELWRTTARELPEIEDHSPTGKLAASELTKVTPDTILDAAGALAWAHRNERSVWAGTLELQGLGRMVPQLRDPLLGLTSGALVRGEGLQRTDGTRLQSKAPGKRFTLSVHPLAAQTASAAEWLAQVGKQADASDAVAPSLARAEHRAWWQSFWQRSHIVISGSAEAEKVSQGYNLQRFLLACASRGRFPMKYNGSLFTVDGTRESAVAAVPVPEVYDADYRMWGGGYWFQNCRLIYWPMLMAGDFDLMQPFFRLYRDILPFAEARSRIYYGHGGAFFPEAFTFWGSYLNIHYGYDRTGRTISPSDVIAAVQGRKSQEPLKPGDVANTYIRSYWQGGIELLGMMADYHSLTQDSEFLHQTLLPMARPILGFYREHYPQRDDQGKMVIKPSQALETWQIAVNPLPEVAGLRWVADQLLQVADLPAADRKAWTELRELLPPLPSRVEYWNKKKYLIPALQYDVLGNAENPELYAIFPYRHFGVSKPELEVGRETYARRLFPGTGCWRQDSIQAALLGLTDEAKRDVVANFNGQHPNHRFPAILGPNFDWIPDHDHGGVAMIALQRMLLQTEGLKILLLPAWPRDWNVSFKLHAPQQTVIECVYRDGQIQSLQVTPESRRKDVEIMLPAATPPPIGVSK